LNAAVARGRDTKRIERAGNYWSRWLPSQRAGSKTIVSYPRYARFLVRVTGRQRLILGDRLRGQRGLVPFDKGAGVLRFAEKTLMGAGHALR
jgi:hypothetical protein